MHNCMPLCPVGSDIVEIESHTYQKLVFRLRDPMSIYIYIYIHTHISILIWAIAGLVERPLLVI